MSGKISYLSSTFSHRLPLSNGVKSDRQFEDPHGTILISLGKVVLLLRAEFVHEQGSSVSGLPPSLRKFLIGRSSILC
jgi:hypothetical protein